MMHKVRAGFTLVEMMVIAPIVILLIGSFIALIVNLTGEVLSSRGSNVLAYNVQDALNRIEQDVKLSTTYLSTTNIDIDGDTAPDPDIPATKQGYARNASEVTNGSTVKFTNIAKTNGSNASLILNVLATSDNPMSNTANFVYLADQPNSCSSAAEYSKNTPMSTNVVYYVDSNETLWRRTIMPYGYDNTDVRCGSAAPWQQPSCTPGYSTAAVPFCKTNDIKLVEGVRPADFQVSYYTSASSNAATSAANNPADITAAGDAVRNTALQSTPTVSVSIISRKTIAGREISQSGTVRATRLDTNATSIAPQSLVTTAPTTPRVSSSVSEGHLVNFTWPRVDSATSYDLDYRINGGAWQPGGVDLDNNSRKFTVSDAWHEDEVEVRVRATNSVGDSAWASNSLTIPLWAPLILRGGWTDYANGYVTAAYTKTKAGLVVLKGLVKGGSGVIGALPQDYRPNRALLFSGSADGSSSRIDVNSNGDVVAQIGGNPWFSLNSVAFLPDGTAFTNLTSFQNSWVNHSPSFAPARYAIDGSGRVNLQGLIKGGTTAGGTPMLSMPAEARADAYTHWPQQNSGSLGHISYIPSSTSLAAKGGGNGYLSINAVYFTISRTDGSNCTTQWCTLSLQNTWTHYGSPYSTPRYTKASDNVVHLKGLIRATSNGTIATLPAGYCPSLRTILTVVSADNWGRVDIIPLAGGGCTISGVDYSTTWVSLDGLMFVAER